MKIIYVKNLYNNSYSESTCSGNGDIQQVVAIDVCVDFGSGDYYIRRLENNIVCILPHINNNKIFFSFQCFKNTFIFFATFYSLSCLIVCLIEKDEYSCTDSGCTACTQQNAYTSIGCTPITDSLPYYTITINYDTPSSSSSSLSSTSLSTLSSTSSGIFNLKKCEVGQ